MIGGQDGAAAPVKGNIVEMMFDGLKAIQDKDLFELVIKMK